MIFPLPILLVAVLYGLHVPPVICEWIAVRWCGLPPLPKQVTQ